MEQLREKLRPQSSRDIILSCVDLFGLRELENDRKRRNKQINSKDKRRYVNVEQNVG